MTEMVDPIRNLMSLYLKYLPLLIGSLLILLVGIIIGAIVGRFVSRVIKDSPLEKYLLEKGIKINASYIAGLIISWAIYLVFLKASADVADLPALSFFVGGLINFVFGMASAIIILSGGFLIAIYAKEQIKKLEIPDSKLISNLAFFLIIYLSVSFALPMAGIEAALVNNILLVIVGALGLGFAIAIGLGLKDVIAELVYTQYISRKYEKISEKQKKK